MSSKSKIKIFSYENVMFSIFKFANSIGSFIIILLILFEESLNSPSNKLITGLEKFINCNDVIILLIEGILLNADAKKIPKKTKVLSF